MLKMDDLATQWWREWKILTDLVIAENVRAGLGIWFASLLEGDPAYDAWIDGIARDERFELWFHGFTGHGPNGEPGREHQGTPYEYQSASFEKSLMAMLTRCDRIVRTYSEHWHGGDATTLRVFNEDPFLRLWMCWGWAHREERERLLPPDRRLLGGTMITIECADPKNWQPGYVNFSEFERGYAGHEADPVLILQGHPWSWTDTSAKPDRTGATLDRWEEFRKILAFLKGRGVRFVTPYDYYRIAMGYATDTTPPTAPTGLKVVPGIVDPAVAAFAVNKILDFGIAA
ncbi:MAG: hypothetical protein AAB368_05310, partial [bacterium]